MTCRGSITLVAFLWGSTGPLGCAGHDSDEGAASQGLLRGVCEGLLEADFATSCGSGPGECEEAGCLVLVGADIVVEPGAGEFTKGSEDPPRDIGKLFDKVGWFDESARDAIEKSGTIVVGDPESETEPYAEIDLDNGRFQLTDGQDVVSVDPSEAAFDDEHYEKNARSLFAPLGVDARQVALEVTGIGSMGMTSSGSSTSTKLVDKTVLVDRAINGIPVGAERLVFSYHADTGKLRKILGRWTAVDYAKSQFSIKYSSIDKLVDDLRDQFTELGVEPKQLSDVSLSLGYAVDEDTHALDLVLLVQHDITIVDMDI
jgi:hypothetical protein